MTSHLSITPHLIREYKGHQAAIYDLIAHENTDYFYSVGGDGWVSRWDISKDNTDGQLIAKTDTQLFCGHFIPHSNHLVVGDMFGHLYWIDLNSNQILHRYHVHRNAIYAIVSPNENIFVTASADGTIGLWEIESMKPQMNIQISNQGLRSLCFHNNILYVGGSDNAIHLVDLDSWKILEKIPQAHANSVFSLLAHSQGLFSGGRDAHLILRPYDDIQSTLHNLPAHWFTLNKIIELKSLDIIATGSRDKTIRLWKPNCEPIFTIDYKISKHTHSVNTLLWLPNHNKLLTAGDDRVVKEFSLFES